VAPTSGRGFSTGVYNRAHNQQPRSSAPKHDSLHMQEGLEYCWCMCAACFDRETKRCTCLSCPDNGGRVAAKAG
jgi:hypothetical protein